jgi:hypothetical protein
MSTKAEQDGRVEQCRLVLSRFKERLVKLNGQLRDLTDNTHKEIVVDLRARRFEVSQAIAMLKRALQ